MIDINSEMHTHHNKLNDHLRCIMNARTRDQRDVAVKNADEYMAQLQRLSATLANFVQNADELPRKAYNVAMQLSDD